MSFPPILGLIFTKWWPREDINSQLVRKIPKCLFINVTVAIKYQQNVPSSQTCTNIGLRNWNVKKCNLVYRHLKKKDKEDIIPVSGTNYQPSLKQALPVCK